MRSNFEWCTSINNEGIVLGYWLEIDISNKSWQNYLGVLGGVGPALVAEWSKMLPLTARCPPSLPGF